VNPSIVSQRDRRIGHPLSLGQDTEGDAIGPAQNARAPSRVTRVVAPPAV
jgi:hypothetical protein